MYYVYLIKSIDHNWNYIGSCDDLRKRFLEHNAGKTKSTKFYAPFKLIYYEAYDTKTLVRKREIELKTNNSEREKLYRRLGLL